MASPRDFSFARRPVWLVGHLVAAAAVAGFVLLGSWQLDRRDASAQVDQLLSDRLDREPAPLAEVPLDDPSAAEYLPVHLTGSYVTAAEVVLQARSLGGISGHEVLTPLRMDDGRLVVVNRGWVDIDAGDPPVVGAEPSGGEVTVTGFLRTTQVRQGIGPTDPATGHLDRISRVDLGRLRAQIGGELLPMWVQLSDQDPAQPGDYPRVVPPPAPGGGPPHLSYAVQWFLFAGVVLVGYPVLLFRTAARRRGRAAASR